MILLFCLSETSTAAAANQGDVTLNTSSFPVNKNLSILEGNKTLNPAVIYKNWPCRNYSARRNLSRTKAPDWAVLHMWGAMRASCCFPQLEGFVDGYPPCQTSQPFSNCSWQPLCPHTLIEGCSFSVSFSAVSDSSLLMRRASVLYINATRSDSQLASGYFTNLRDVRLTDWQSDSSRRQWEDHTWYIHLAHLNASSHRR